MCSGKLFTSMSSGKKALNSLIKYTYNRQIVTNDNKKTLIHIEKLN
jgi:hypothetical protein